MYSENCDSHHTKVFILRQGIEAAFADTVWVIANLVPICIPRLWYSTHTAVRITLDLLHIWFWVNLWWLWVQRPFSLPCFPTFISRTPYGVLSHPFISCVLWNHCLKLKPMSQQTQSAAAAQYLTHQPSHPPVFMIRVEVSLFTLPVSWDFINNWGYKVTEAWKGREIRFYLQI